MHHTALARIDALIEPQPYGRQGSTDGGRCSSVKATENEVHERVRCHTGSNRNTATGVLTKRQMGNRMGNRFSDIVSSVKVESQRNSHHAALYDISV